MGLNTGFTCCDMPDATPIAPLIPVSAAAKLMGISDSKAYELAREGHLAGLVMLPGHRQVVRRAVLVAWLAGQPVDSTAQIAPAPLRRVG